MSESKCDYCGAKNSECHECRKKVQFDILQLVSLLEQGIIKPDETDVVGINHHLRLVWGFRDAVNDYFQ